VRDERLDLPKKPVVPVLELGVHQPRDGLERARVEAEIAALVVAARKPEAASSEAEIAASIAAGWQPEGAAL
jgi:hypothetical protein